MSEQIATKETTNSKETVTKQTVTKQTNNSKQTTNKKRKRQRPDPEEQLQTERKERYDKLVYQSKKALHKEAKVVKSFEVQKVVRRIKDSKDEQKELNEKLATLKNLPIDTVVDICIRRLGIPNLNPNLSEEEATPPDAADAFVEKMLQHKRLGGAMEIWNEKVTEYRRWYLKRVDVVSGVPKFVKEMQPKNSKKKKQEDSTADMFVSLGGLQDEEEEENKVMGKYDSYGPASGLEMEVKKNRPGQRQRQAKALAKEARKQGRTVDKSINWREKKVVTDDTYADEKPSFGSKSKDVKPQQVEASKIAEMGKTWKEEGKAHPSWAASASQKTGIVAFAGKKITFD